MARANKFASVNLNELYGKEKSASKSAGNSFGSASRLRGASHGGMLVLTRPVKQQGKIGGGYSGNLKKEHSESLPVDTKNDASDWTKTQPQVESSPVEVIKEKSGAFPVHPLKRSDVYVPPSLRGLHPVTVSPTLANSQSRVVEKDVVLHGEEFPTLQASLAPAAKNIHNQVKDLHQNQDRHVEFIQQQGRLRQISQQATLKKGSHDSVGPVGSVSQPTQSQFFRPPQMREDSHVIKAEEEIGNFDRSLFTDPFMIRVDHTAEWADDERENSNGERPVTVNRDPRLDIGNSQEAMPCIGMRDRYEREISSHPGSRGDSCRSEVILRPESGGGRYESVLISQPGSGGIECSQPGPGGRRCEREVLSRPGSRGSDYVRPGSADIGYRNKGLGSSNGRYERKVISPPGSGVSEYIHLGPGGGRYEREIIPRPGSGGSDYTRPGLAGVHYRMKRPDSGASRYEREVFPRRGSAGSEYIQLGSEGGRQEREVISQLGLGVSDNNQPGLGGSDWIQGLAGVDYGMTQLGLGGSDYKYGRDQCSDREFKYNAQKKFDQGMANCQRVHGPDVHHGWQNMCGTYESCRENGAYRGNSFRAGVTSRALPNRENFGKRAWNVEEYGRDGTYNSSPVEGTQNFGQGMLYDRLPEQPREQERDFGCYIGTRRDVVGGRYDDSTEAYNEFSRPRSGGHGGVDGSGRPLAFPSYIKSRPSFDNLCLPQEESQPKDLDETAGKVSAPDLWVCPGLQGPLDAGKGPDFHDFITETSGADYERMHKLEEDDQRTNEVDIGKQDERRDDNSPKKMLVSNEEQVKQVNFKQDIPRSWDEEKRHYLREEEQRKENARKKLLELEERIAKREAEQKRKTEDIQQRTILEIAECVLKEDSLGQQEDSTGPFDNRRAQIKAE